MLRMGKNPTTDEVDPHPERTYSPYQSEYSPYHTEGYVPPPPKPEGAFPTQLGQERQMETDPYGLVGAEVTLDDPDRWDHPYPSYLTREPGQTQKLRLLKYVGSGGMGAVFYSVSPLRGPIAIKVLKPDLAHKFPQFVELFAREVAAVKSLSHPNIVKFVGSGRLIQGYPFIAVEWLEGKTLDQHLTIELSMQRVLTLFEQIGSALALAHKLKIIHLDLKPENIFVVPTKGSEVVKVIDFGISRVLSTYSGTTFTRFGGGSLQYCSPEQFGGKVSARSDIFSLGVMLYHMLAGALPIGGTYIAAKQLKGPLPQLPSLSACNKDVNDDVEAVIAKAIQFDPSDRYQSVDELLSNLQRALRVRPQKDIAPKTTNKTSNATKPSIWVCLTCNAKNRVNERKALMSQPICGGCGEKLSFVVETTTRRKRAKAHHITDDILAPGNPEVLNQPVTGQSCGLVDRTSPLDTRLRVAVQEIVEQKKRINGNQHTK